MINESTIRSTLEPRIIGRTLPPWKCCCGSLGNGESRAVALRVWPDAVDKCYAWSVEMIETANPSRGYFTGLSAFIDRRELGRLFGE